MSSPTPRTQPTSTHAARVAAAQKRAQAYARHLDRLVARQKAKDAAKALARASRPVRVGYVLFGSASTATITYTTRHGTGQRDIQVPHERGPRITLYLPHGAFAQFSAQNGGAYGTLTCEIYANGRRISHTVSSGAYAIVDCDADVP